MAQNNRRGRSGRRRQGGGNNPNRSIDSQGPEVKIRGTAQQVYDKYTALARDAFSSGDRIRGESLQQHAEHYYRMLQAMQPKDKPQDQQSQPNQQDQGQQNAQADAKDADKPAEKAEQGGQGGQGQGRRRNKDKDEGPVAAQSTGEPAKMDGAEQAAADDASGTGAEAAETAEEAPKRRRRTRRRREDADGEATAKGGDAPEPAAEKAPEEASA